jgi:hypothetical protein
MGVGTHTKTASAASRAASSGDTIRKPAANPCWRRHRRCRRSASGRRGARRRGGRSRPRR